MKKGNKNKLDITACILILLTIMVLFQIKEGNFVWHTNLNRYINKSYNKTICIKGDSTFSYKGKAYRIVFGTSADKKEELYLQCFEEIAGGLICKPTYGAAQGESKSLYGITNHYVDSGKDSFYIVYGYNNGLKAKNFSVKRTKDGTWTTQDISKEEYFLYTFTDIEYPNIAFRDAKNNDITMNLEGIENKGL